MKNQCLENSKLKSALNFASPKLARMFAFLALSVFLSAPPSFAQSNDALASVSLEQVRWKSENQIRDMLGDPKSIRGPIGTHASYQLWNYDGFSVAFANNRAFHLFDENSLKKFELDESRQ